MSIHLLVFLAGLFVVPVIMLAVGHKLRRRSPRVRSAFWGAVIGYCIAGTLAVSLGMVPPEAWQPEERFRGFIGLWSMVVMPAIGAAVGMLRARD